MGREIRLVPPNWEHPKNGRGQYAPLFERDYTKEREEWLSGLRDWEAKTHPDYDPKCDFWDHEGNPPSRDRYVDYGGREPTWVQMYETVSEGTPVSPPFATRAELVEYLVAHGDVWDQLREDQGGGKSGWKRDAAERFVNSGFAPSMMVVDGRVLTPKDMTDEAMGKDG